MPGIGVVKNLDEAAGLVKNVIKNADLEEKVAKNVLDKVDEFMPELKRSMDSPDIAPLLGNAMKSSDEAAGVGKKVGKSGDEVGKGIEDAVSDSDILIDTYKNMRDNPDIVGQAHHLNQNAAFKDIISKNDGLCVELEGNAFKNIGSPHYSAHKNLENYWNNFRTKGHLYGDIPTISNYNSALYDSLRAAGLTDTQAKIAVQSAIKQQSKYGLSGGSLVPKIPGKINFKK
ncbi:MAG: hypothetical protein AAGU14_11925 [Eubacteriaceae bacterium]